MTNNHFGGLASNLVHKKRKARDTSKEKKDFVVKGTVVHTSFTRRHSRADNTCMSIAIFSMNQSVVLIGKTGHKCNENRGHIVFFQSSNLTIFELLPLTQAQTIIASC